MKKIIPPKTKAAIALEAVKRVKSASQLGSEYEAHPIQIGIWKKQLLENAHLLFSGERREKEREHEALIDRLYKIIGQRDTELEWLKKNCTLSHEERVAALARGHTEISLARQAELLNVSRSSLYYTPKETPEDKEHMDMIDAIYTDYPFYGSRRIRLELIDRYGVEICREHVQRLMRAMGIEAVYPKLKTSIPSVEHKKYPYLLKDLAISHPNHVWGTDITYIRLEEGWAYLVALIDWFSRLVLSWELALSMETDFCIAALERALSFAQPEIHNSD